MSKFMRTKKSGSDSLMEASERIREMAGDLTASARDKATTALATARESGGDWVETTKENVLRLAEGGRKQAADRFEECRRAASSAARRIMEEGDDVLGAHLHDLTRKLSDVSKYLDNRKVKNLAGDLGDFARKNPGIVLGGTLLAGFVLVRFLKGSSYEGVSATEVHSAPATYHPPIADQQTDTIR